MKKESLLPTNVLQNQCFHFPNRRVFISRVFKRYLLLRLPWWTSFGKFLDVAHSLGTRLRDKHDTCRPAATHSNASAFPHRRHTLASWSAHTLRTLRNSSRWLPVSPWLWRLTHDDSVSMQRQPPLPSQCIYAPSCSRSWCKPRCRARAMHQPRFLSHSTHVKDVYPLFFDWAPPRAYLSMLPQCLLQGFQAPAVLTGALSKSAFCSPGSFRFESSPYQLQAEATDNQRPQVLLWAWLQLASSVAFVCLWAIHSWSARLVCAADPLCAHICRACDNRVSRFARVCPFPSHARWQCRAKRRSLWAPSSASQREYCWASWKSDAWTSWWSTEHIWISYNHVLCACSQRLSVPSTATNEVMASN